MQKQSYKKILTILIATILSLSILPISMAQAAVLTIDTPIMGTIVYVGDVIWVNGTADVGSLVKVYWDIIIEANKLGQGYAIGGKFNITVTIPEDVVGYHWIIADGRAVRVAMEPKITLTPNKGIPDDTVTVSGTGYAADKTVTVSFYNTTKTMNVTTIPSPVKTSTKGSFSCSFKVPSWDYGPYYVSATDAALNTASATFTIGAAITITPVEGPSGTVVDITGRGFSKVADKTVTIKIDTTTAPVVADIKTEADGTFSGQFIVPEVSVGSRKVNATDGTYWSTADFEVTGVPGITLDPKSGAPGTEVTIEGVNFTAIASTSVTVKFAFLTVKTLSTNSTGGFKGTFAVPSMPTQ